MQNYKDVLAEILIDWKPYRRSFKELGEQIRRIIPMAIYCSLHPAGACLSWLILVAVSLSYG